MRRPSLAGFGRPLTSLGVIHQFSGPLLQLFDEVGTTNAEGVVNPGIQSILAVKREVALENHPVETRQYGDNQVTEPGKKSSGELHGVLLWMVV